MNELSISLPIADRSYRLAIDRAHEELFRRAAKMIDKRIKDYSGTYAYKDKQDLLAMVALEYATGYLQNNHLLTDNDKTWRDRLASLDHELDEHFKGDSPAVL